MRLCKECKDKITCKRCNSQLKENKELEVNVNELKRQRPIPNWSHASSF